MPYPARGTQATPSQGEGRGRHPDDASTTPRRGGDEHHHPGRLAAERVLRRATGTSRLDVRVRETALALLGPREQLFVDRLVERRLLVLGQALLPADIGSLRRVECAVQLPLLEAVVVRQLRSPERVLEVGQRVR